MITGWVRKMLGRPSGRYLLIGVSVYIFELVIIFITMKLGVSAIIAVGLSFWLGLIVSFILQKFVTFKDTRTHHRVLVPQILAITLLILWNFAFTIILTSLLVNLLPAFLIRTVALGITTAWNFYLYKRRIFTSDNGTVY